MNESDIERIDYDELTKQRKEELIASNEFVSVEILIGCEDNEPIVEFKARNVSDLEMAYMIASLEETARNLAKKFPEAGTLAKRYKAHSITLNEDEKLREE